MNRGMTVVELKNREEMARRFASDEFLEIAVQKAVRAAVREHKLSGNPVADWRGGQVVIVPPEDIPSFAEDT
jgi:hypothetical protein